MAMTGYPGDGTGYVPPQQQQERPWYLDTGNDAFMPGTKIKRADGTYVQKMADGSYQPYIEFNTQKDENGNVATDENGNWKMAEGTSTTPSNVGSTDIGDTTQVVGGMTLPEPDTEQANPRAQTRRAWPWWSSQYNPWGREPSANYKEDLANNYDKSAANQQMVGQRYWQEANKDFRNEQSKNDQAQANTRFTESQQQLNGSDNTSLVGRELVTNDPTQREQWQVSQVANAKQAQEAEINDRNSAVQWRKTGAEDQYRYRQLGLYNMGSTMLSMGPGKEKNTPKPPEPQVQTDNNPPPAPNEWYGKASHQDVLNCMMQKHWKEVNAKYPDVKENNQVNNWREVTKRPDHTVGKQPELDTPEYYQAVEELADKLWNGEQITVGGKTFGGNGVSGPDAAYALWGGRGGSKGWEEKQDQTKWGTATKAEKGQVPQPAPGQQSSQPNISTMYANSQALNGGWADSFLKNR